MYSEVDVGDTLSVIAGASSGAAKSHLYSTSSKYERTYHLVLQLLSLYL